VRYDDGDVDESVSEIRPHDHGPAAMGALQRLALARTLTVGTAVNARFGGNQKLYPGVIHAANDDGTFAVAYGDGDFEEHVHIAMIELQAPPKQPRRVHWPFTQKRGEYAVTSASANGGASRRGRGALVRCCLRSLCVVPCVAVCRACGACRRRRVGPRDSLSALGDVALFHVLSYCIDKQTLISVKRVNRALRRVIAESEPANGTGKQGVDGRGPEPQHQQQSLWQLALDAHCCGGSLGGLSPEIGACAAALVGPPHEWAATADVSLSQQGERLVGTMQTELRLLARAMRQVVGDAEATATAAAASVGAAQGAGGRCTDQENGKRDGDGDGCDDVAGSANRGGGDDGGGGSRGGTGESQQVLLKFHDKTKIVLQGVLRAMRHASWPQEATACVAAWLVFLCNTEPLLKGVDVLPPSSGHAALRNELLLTRKLLFSECEHTQGGFSVSSTSQYQRCARQKYMDSFGTGRFEPIAVEDYDGDEDDAFKSEDGWTREQQAALRAALKAVPQGGCATKKERWEKICEKVPDKSLLDCAEQYRKLHAMLQARFRRQSCMVAPAAGARLLARFEDVWAAMHCLYLGGPSAAERAERAAARAAAAARVAQARAAQAAKAHSYGSHRADWESGWELRQAEMELAKMGAVCSTEQAAVAADLAAAEQRAVDNEVAEKEAVAMVRKVRMALNAKGRLTQSLELTEDGGAPPPAAVIGGAEAEDAAAGAPAIYESPGNQGLQQRGSVPDIIIAEMSVEDIEREVYFQPDDSKAIDICDMSVADIEMEVEQWQPPSVGSEEWQYEWDVQAISAWLKKEGFSQHCAAFERECIDGAALVDLMQGGELDFVMKDELGISNLTDRSRVRLAVKELLHF
jgi:hypothetical protein